MDKENMNEKVKQAIEKLRELDYYDLHNEDLKIIETALNQAEENNKSQFVKVCNSRIRLNSIDRYFASYEFDFDGSGTGKQKKNYFVVINNNKCYCDSEKEANDYVKMLDELLGVNDENSNSKAQ